MLNYAVLTSDDAINKARRKLERRIAFCGGVCSNALLFYGAMALIGLALTPKQPASVAWAVVVSAVVSLTLAGVLKAMQERYAELAYSLTPLSDTGDCEAALALCQEHDIARQLRDRALKAGRQLYRFDYIEMEAKVHGVLYAGQLEHARVAREQACKALHQVN